MFLTHLDCTECNYQGPADGLATLCPECSAPLAARYDLGAVSRAVKREQLARRPADMWRFAEVLPLADPKQAVSFGEGGTPLLWLPRLAAELGLDGDELEAELSLGHRGPPTFSTEDTQAMFQRLYDQTASHDHPVEELAHYATDPAYEAQMRTVQREPFAM